MTSTQCGPAAGGAAGEADIGYAADRRSDTTIAPNAATRATWGEPPATRRPRTLALVAWRPVVKGALRGFAAIELPIGLKIHDVPVLVSNGKPWASLPSKPQIDRDGRQKTDANGKAAFAPVLEWRSREISERFSKAVVALVRAAHPDDLDDGAP
jgi:hypothetical protein